MNNQTKRKRVEIEGEVESVRSSEIEGEVESVMSSATNNRLLNDNRYFDHVDQILFDLRFEDEWRTHGTQRYYSEGFWSCVTTSFNQRVQAVGLPPLSVRDLISFMDSRTNEYYMMRANNNFFGKIGATFKVCDNCCNIPYFPRKFEPSSGRGSASGSVGRGSASGSFSGGHSSREMQVPDAYSTTILELYAQGQIDAHVYINATAASPEHKRLWVGLDSGMLIPLLHEWSNLIVPTWIELHCDSSNINI